MPEYAAGLNTVPKRCTLAKYLGRLDTSARAQLIPLWLVAIHTQGLPRSDDFELDFHAIPPPTATTKRRRNEQRDGDYPSLLVFDSTLTTYASLAVLGERGIGCRVTGPSASSTGRMARRAATGARCA